MMRLLLLLNFAAVAAPDLHAADELSQTAYAAGRQGDRAIRSFNYRHVELLPSRHEAQFRQVRDFYMRLRPNDLLRGFRLKDRDWAPGKDLGGAYSERPLSFGQWLAGFARIYRVTGDVAVRDRAVYLMREWAKTIGEDGSYGYEHGQGEHYDYDKFVGGLVDMYEYAGCDDALGYLDKITTWAEANLDRSNEYALPKEWYTLSENLYRAYELTGEQRYDDFAKVWEYSDFWDVLATRGDVFAELKHAKQHPSYHAYSHVNSLSSAAMAYSANGEQRYLDAIVNGYDFLKDTQLFATGGFGPEESFIVPNGLPETLVGIRRGEANVDVRFHFETSCGSWAGFKLARYLMEFTGDAHYGDWIERLVYNGVGAMLPMNDYGMIMYGSSYNTYGAQKSLSTVWFCCQGSLPQTVADYHNLIYFHDDDSLYVNLFLPSAVEWQRPVGRVRVVQETRFPEDHVVRLRIETDTANEFGVKIRVPLWASDGVGVAINEQTQDVETVPGAWAELKREWSPGDVVTLTFDITPRAEPLPGYVSPVAVMCGPVVMVQATARDTEDALPADSGLRYPADYLEVGADVRINRARNLHTNQELRPFYDVNAGEFYLMYFNREGRKRIALTGVQFAGDWRTEGAARRSEERGASFSAKFNGTAVTWEGRRFDDGGIAAVAIDGEDFGEVDQYAYAGVHVGRMDQREVPFRWSATDLAPGEHTIEVTVIGRSNPGSSGTAINVSGLSAFP
ncbi:hypothetical protein Pla108_41370 [Botrimarina colliarenosi]|uniref:Non-reducing end beta-L-arabinofuranosidase n=1 Tax=Botrimarina colliarenosi TaxID=2528001 RepID=A0A5C5ZYR1_9BACT|nr:beta-L-arabinofuranosidase domain-containing protein [Botrimarina colliarenosi]TWT92127.1 hypothetical protein Pla108_41370 [Botrimarina colliarenosi]